MSSRIRGTFEVTITPQTGAEAPVGRLSLAKRYHGPLAASSTGEMLAVHGGVQGSAGYVAMEKVTGTLEGRQGAFALQHSGSMDRGAQSLVIAVVPDSGTDALAGLKGTLAIEITDGQHFYVFDYTLPES